MKTLLQWVVMSMVFMILSINMLHAQELPQISPTTTIQVGGEILGVLELADGNIIARNANGSITLYDPAGQLLATMTGHTNGVYSLIQLSDGRIVSSGRDFAVRFWSASGEALSATEGLVTFADQLLELSNGNIAIPAGNLYLLDSTGQIIANIEERPDGFREVLELPDGQIVTIGRGSAPNSISIWDSTLENRVQFGQRDTRGIKLLSNGTLISWSGLGYLDIWDFDGNNLASVSDIGHGFYDLIELVDGNIAVRRDESRDFLVIYDAELNQISEHQIAESDILGMVELSGGRVAVWSKDIYIFGETISDNMVLEGHVFSMGNGDIIELADGRLLSRGDRGDDYPNFIRLWNSDGTPAAVFTQEDVFRVNGMFMLSDGRILSWSNSTETSASIYLWEIN